MGGDDVGRVAEDKGCVGLMMVKCSGGGERGGHDMKYFSEVVGM